MLAQALSVSPLELLYGKDDGAEIEFVPDLWMRRLGAVERFSGIDESALREYEETVGELLETARGLEKSAQLMEKIIERNKRSRADDGG